MSPELSADARRHIRGLLRAIAPAADRLETRFREVLQKQGRPPVHVDSLVAITPGAAARRPTLRGFFQQVEANGRMLARLNAAPAEATGALETFADLLETEVKGRFAPAREQLQLATVLTLSRAFYDVREAESRCFFGLYQAEMDAADLPGLLRRFVRVLTHALGAGTGRLLLPENPEGAPMPAPGYLEAGELDREMGGRYACYWSYPMGARAVLQLGFRARRRWLPREESLLHVAAERFNEAFSRVKMEGELRRLNAAARSAEEEERRRIGRELHDEAGQSLLLLRLTLEMLEREAPAALGAKLGEARGVAERTIAELRRIVAALSPAVLERLGLEAALRHLAGRFGRVHPAALRMRIAMPADELALDQQQVIYRVAQEALQNITKHSRATRVNFLLKATDRDIRLCVSDNGAGFSTEQAERKPMSFGLGGMRERAALLGGKLTIQSAPGKGAKVILALPYCGPVAPNGKDSHTHN